jgi:hypothetical protein
MVEAPIICPSPPGIDVLKLKPTPPTAAVMEGKAIVYFTFKEYENMALNLQDILFLIKQQKAAITYYKDCVSVRSPD